MDDSSFPYVVGRGRGGLGLTPMPYVVGFSRGGPITSTPITDYGRATQAHTVNASHDATEDPVSSPARNNVTTELLSDLMKQLGSCVSENIVSCLESRGLGSLSQREPTVNVNSPRAADPSKVNIIVKPEKEPPVFRGDGTDKVSIHEWEESVKGYLKKSDVILQEQSDEVLSKLQGRARDVVRIGLRSNPLVVLSEGPRPIFDILKQHFGETVSSCMPLADFYTTHPFHNELPFDYWIRLNKAIDATEEALKRQGKTLDNPTREVTVMFIRYCPDPELALIFKCKPLEEWTAGEVQMRLDECQREHRLKQRQSTRLAGSVVPPVRPTGVLHACAQTAEKSPATQPPPVPTQPSESQSLERVISLLERVLEQGSFQRNVPARRPQRRPRDADRSRGPCQICGEAIHSTDDHCSIHRLCFICHAPGHIASACTVTPSPSSRSAQPSNSGPGQQGN